MFLWKKEFELGIKTIDEQHKKLLSIGNRISELLAVHNDGDDDYVEIYTVIEQLRHYTDYHFKAEEELLVKYNYPEYHIHKKQHDDFIAYLDSVNYYTINDQQTQFLKELLEKIILWVFNHIATTDVMYKDYLLELGMK